MKPLWAALLATPIVAGADEAALSAQALRQSCAALTGSGAREDSGACRLYLQGLLAGASSARAEADPSDPADWESRAARTRLGPRVRRAEPGAYCLPKELTPPTLARAVLREDVQPEQSADDWVDAALRRQYPCGKR